MKARPFTSLAITVLMPLSTALGLGRFLCDSSFSGRAASHEMGQLVAGHARGGPVTNGLQLFIAAQRAPIPEDQPLAIVFHVTNVGTTDLDFGWCRSSWQPNFTVAVTTDRGEAVLRRKPDPAVGSYMGWRIAPGGEKVEVGDLRDEYALRPGKYYVTATESYQRGDDPQPHATSNTIKVMVISAPKGSTARLRLATGIRSVFDRPEEVDESIRLTNQGDRVVEISSEEGQLWFHDVRLDFRTLSGELVLRKRDADGREVPFEKDAWGLYGHGPAAPGPLQPGDYLDGGILIYKAYDLTSGTAYTLVTHVTLQTSDGPMELVSNTVTFALTAN
jgi:hypothetical protein